MRGQVTEPSGKITKFTVDRWRQPVQTINTLGQTTTVTYDANGLPVNVQHATGAADSTAYNTNGLPTYIKASGVTAVEIGYNATWKTQPDSVAGSNRPSQRFWVGANGRVDSIANPKTRYLYDSFGRVTQVKDANNAIVGTRTPLKGWDLRSSRSEAPGAAAGPAPHLHGCRPGIRRPAHLGIHFARHARCCSVASIVGPTRGTHR